MAIIGLSGRKQSGKDTVAQIIKENLGSWEIRRFADKLKDIVCLLLDCTRDQIEDPGFKETPLGPQWEYYYNNTAFGRKIYSSEKEYYEGYIKKFRVNVEKFPPKKDILTPRKILQLLGTEGGRELIHPNIWCITTLSNYNPKKDNWIIPDCRFVNEANNILALGGKLFRIERADIESTDKHESETALDNYEYFSDFIFNDGSLKDLKELVLKKVNLLKIS